MKVGSFKIYAQGATVSLVTFIFILGILELILRNINYGDPLKRMDPFHGFEGTNRIYYQEYVPEKGLIYLPSPNKSQITQDFPVKKAPNTFRTFVLGGSTTAGSPWGLKGSFAYWMDKKLSQDIPNMNFETINVGLSGQGSSRVLTVMKEMVGYDPDLFVVYTGQNEFRDARYHADEIKRSRINIQIRKILFASRAFYFVYEKYLILKGKVLGGRHFSKAQGKIADVVSKNFTEDSFLSFDYYRLPEVDTSDFGDKTESKLPKAKPFYELKLIAKNLLGPETWRDIKHFLGYSSMSDSEVFWNFGANIRQMIDIAKSMEIDIIFLEKAKNLKHISALDSYSIKRAVFRQGTESLWHHHYSEGIQEIKNGRCKEALPHFQKVRKAYKSGFEFDDKLLSLYMGECYERIGLFERARMEYGNRPLSRHFKLNQILREESLELNIPVVNVSGLFNRNAKNGIIGYHNYFVDGVHMTRRGYKEIGCVLAEVLFIKNFIKGREEEQFFNESSCSFPEANASEISEQFRTVKVFARLGWTAFHLGEIEKALKFGILATEDLSALEEKSYQYTVQAHLLLGYVYTKMMKHDQAFREWEILRGYYEIGHFQSKVVSGIQTGS